MLHKKCKDQITVLESQILQHNVFSLLLARFQLLKSMFVFDNKR